MLCHSPLGVCHDLRDTSTKFKTISCGCPRQRYVGQARDPLCTEKCRFINKRVREISRFFCAATRVRPCRLARLTDCFIQKSFHLSNCTLQHREIPSRPPTIVIRVQVFLPIILDSSSHTSAAFPTTTRPPSQSARPFPFISRFLPCPN